MWGSVTYLNNILPLSLFLTMLSSLKIDDVYCPFSYLTDFTVQSILKFPSEIRALFFKLVWHMKILDGKLSNWRPVAWIQSLWKLLYLGSRNSTSLSFFVLLLQFVTAHQNIDWQLPLTYYQLWISRWLTHM